MGWGKLMLRNSVRLWAVFIAIVASSPIQASPPSPPPLEAYGELPSVEDMAISPDGKSLATVARVNGGRKLLLNDVAGKLLNQIEIGTVKFRGVEWAGNDNVIVTNSWTQRLPYGYTADKFEAFNVFVVPRDGSLPHAIFRKNPTLLDAAFGNYGVRLINGKWQGMFGGVRLEMAADRSGYVFEHGRPELVMVDIAGTETRRLARSASEGHGKRWLVDGEGTVAAALDVAAQSGRWTVLNADSKTIASGEDLTGNTSLVSLGKDGSSVIYSVENDAEGEVHWYEVPLSGGTPTEIFSDVSVDRIYVDKTNGRMLGYLPLAAAPQPVIFDPARQAILRRVYRAFPGLSVCIQDWTPDFAYVLVRTSGNGDAGTWFLVDVKQRKADWVGSERPLLRAENVGAISTFAYSASDGTEMDGILTLPPGRDAKNLPIVIMPHGGPTSHDEAAFDWWAQAYASRGYAVFQPNFRGSTNRDDAFRRAGYGEWGRKMQTDISDGLAELVKKGIVDPKRACIVGASYGGYAALAGVTLQQGLYRCAVAVAPVSDLRMFYDTEYRESGESRMTSRSLRETLGNPKGFDAVSPRRFANKADAPILLIHGRDDTVVPYRQSQVMADALRASGKPVEMVEFKEEDHWLSRSATRKQMLEVSMRFVQQHNPAD